MADNGKLYTGFTVEFAKEMARLCGKADVIVPNMTEASFMLGIDYVGSGYTEDYVKQVLKGLCDLGPQYAVLTGVDYGDGKLGVACMEKESGKVFTYFRDRIDRSYHGTVDVYASSLVGALMNGKTLEESLKVATDYTVACIARTASSPDSVNYGVEFEKEVPYLLELLK